MLAKKSSTADGLQATRGLVSNPKNVASNGGKISVKGKHSVTSGANACCLHPHASYLVLSTVDRNGNTVTHPESLITRTGDIKVFTIETRDGMSTLRDILDDGYRRVEIVGDRGPVNHIREASIATINNLGFPETTGYNLINPSGNFEFLIIPGSRIDWGNETNFDINLLQALIDREGSRYYP